MDKKDNEILYGRNTVLESIRTKEIGKIYLQKNINFSNLLIDVKKRGIPYVFVEKKYLDSITSGGVHQGIAAILSLQDFCSIEDLITKNKRVENPLIIMLDEVQDPQNLGAIIRIVDAFQTNGIIFNKRRNVQLTGTVAKVSTGAINYVDIVRSNNLRQSIKKLKKEGYWIAYLDMNGEYSINTFKYDMPLVVIVGGEDKGVTDSIKKVSDFGISIQMNGHVNSLNVASAVSILCYQKSIFS